MNFSVNVRSGPFKLYYLLKENKTSRGSLLEPLTIDVLLQVLLQKCEVESMMHSPGDYILLSADKYEVKVNKKYQYFLLTCIMCITGACTS